MKIYWSGFDGHLFDVNIYGSKKELQQLSAEILKCAYFGEPVQFSAGEDGVSTDFDIELLKEGE